MAKGKHYVFSARTTREGLRRLNDVKRERGVGWDELVVDAVCAHYGLDRSELTLARPGVEELGEPTMPDRAGDVDIMSPTEANEVPKPRAKTVKRKARPEAAAAETAELG